MSAALSPRRAELEAVARALGPAARRQHPLGALTTYRVGGPADVYVEVGSEAELEQVRRALAGHRVPVLVLGKGSNLLVADAGFPGVVVHPTAELGTLALPAAGGVVRAGAALGLPVLARRSVEAGLTGLEWAVGVPGSVGGAVRMNAGGHGSDMAATVVRYRWVELAPDPDAPGGGEEGGEAGPERLALGYRTSSIAANQVVVWAEFQLEAGDPVVGRATLAEIVRWRRQHQPGGSNAGSVFANPPGDSAGRLVDQAGLRGHRRGSARVSDKHANFIQADDGGSADDVAALMDHVRTVVAERSGVVLRSEVQMVGFERPGEDG